MKKIRFPISIILIICVMLCNAIIFTADAAQITEGKEQPNDIYEITDEYYELQPQMATHCGIVYVNHSIHPDDFTYPNATIYYTSTGTSSGTVYSIIYTNSFGGTTVRHDIVPYNGTSFGHGNISGPHTHTYSWWVYNGMNRYKQDSIRPYTR